MGTCDALVRAYQLLNTFVTTTPPPRPRRAAPRLSPLAPNHASLFLPSSQRAIEIALKRRTELEVLFLNKIDYVAAPAPAHESTAAPSPTAVPRPVPGPAPSPATGTSATGPSKSFADVVDLTIGL